MGDLAAEDPDEARPRARPLFRTMGKVTPTEIGGCAASNVLKIEVHIVGDMP